MLRVIFDTNVYGKLIEEYDRKLIEKRIKDEPNFMVYHFPLIRKELRNIPKTSKASRRARVLLLTLYDHITEGRFLKNSIAITKLAKAYYDKYRSLGGVYNWDSNIRIDFIIVACASVYGLDIVYSDDKRTMLSKTALKAYKQINLKENVGTPDFLSYQDLLKKFRNRL